MNRSAIIFLGVFLVCGLAYSIVGRTSTASAHQVEQVHVAEVPVLDEWAIQNLALQAENQQHIESIIEMENTRNRLAAAEERMASDRRVLQVRGQEAWTALIASHSETYNQLRQKVALSGEKAKCTICDGTGRMSGCTLCAHDGKCVTCGGKGIKAHGETCGACVGTGECYLCLGSGKLECLFCWDGEISLDLPTPSARMPVEY